MKAVTFEYNCSRCHKVYDGAVTAEDKPGGGQTALIRAMMGERDQSVPSRQQPHDCGDKGTGIANLVGCRVTEVGA